VGCGGGTLTCSICPLSCYPVRPLPSLSNRKSRASYLSLFRLFAPPLDCHAYFPGASVLCRSCPSHTFFFSVPRVFAISPPSRANSLTYCLVLHDSQSVFLLTTSPPLFPQWRARCFPFFPLPGAPPFVPTRESVLLFVEALSYTRVAHKSPARWPQAYPAPPAPSIT